MRFFNQIKIQVRILLQQQVTQAFNPDFIWNKNL